MAGKNLLEHWLVVTPPVGFEPTTGCFQSSLSPVGVPSIRQRPAPCRWPSLRMTAAAVGPGTQTHGRPVPVPLIAAMPPAVLRLDQAAKGSAKQPCGQARRRRSCGLGCE